MAFGRSDLGAPNSKEDNVIPDLHTSRKIDALTDADNEHTCAIWSALLATAVVRLRLYGETSHPLRVLCDTGAQSNSISAHVVKQLRWPTQRCNIQFSGVNGLSQQKHTQKLECYLLSRFSDEPVVKIQLIVVPQVLKEWLPHDDVSLSLIPEEIRSKLADPFVHKSAPIDAILGSGVWAISAQNGGFSSQVGIAYQPSVLGWMIFGGGVERCEKITVGAVVNLESEELIAPLIQRLWELEVMLPTRIRTMEQEQCEEFFIKNYRRLENGRHEVGIPLRKDVEQFGSSRVAALLRYHQLERRFRRDPELKQKYCSAINEMITEGHMKLVDRQPIGQSYHIPHHAVTSKFRVVFDASCQTDKNVSLNEVQLVGEKLQNDLQDIIMRFRCHPVAVTADIRKMYLQVKVKPEQWDLQRVFWRPNDHSEIQEYWLTVVTFGMASAPHCAVRAMIQGARDSQSQYPMGAVAIEHDFYMDDCLTGAEDVETARKLCHEMDALQRSYGFVLDKWRSNCSSVVPSSAELVPVDDVLEVGELSDTTVLGLRWIPKSDELMYKFRPSPILDAHEATKRRLLSLIMQIFDPNGYVGPVIITARILMQRLWSVRMKWDSIVSDDIFREWRQFQEQLHVISQIRIPRWLGISNIRNVSLHGFADASERAYGAVLYVRIETETKVECVLVASKGRVAPLKPLTIPRLELCGAQLLTELVEAFRRATNKQYGKITLWTDSAIVLAWLTKDASTLKMYVNNRVQRILRRTVNDEWRHVPSADNPADILSRGMMPIELLDARLWWKGPTWLMRPEHYWPNLAAPSTQQTLSQIQTEMKTESDQEQTKEKFRWKQKTLVSAVSIQLQSTDLLSRISDAHRLFRVTAYVLRFIAIVRGQTEKRCQGVPTHEEIDEAFKFWLRREQVLYYPKEIKILRENDGKLESEQQTIDRSSTILRFNPMMWKNEGILRLGGRLGKSLLAFEQKHPALLPEVSPLAQLLVRQAHDRTLHGGPRQMMALLRQKVWITGLRRLIHTNNSRCMSCVRQQQKCAQQMMADLPTVRTEPRRPFSHTGVDYAGPFELKARSGRCKIIEKKYVAVFVCMVSKAVHLELAEDLSTKEFIQAYLRFTSIRGSCYQLWSDNGRNFVGAEKELARMLRGWNQMDLGSELQQLGTEWHFITPSAPHQGGLWEAAVKSMKHHLRRVMGKEMLTSSEFRTVLAQTSAAMNSRPLAALSEDPNDLEFLTPGHFLCGEAMIQLFGKNVLEAPTNSLKRAEQIQQKSQLIWKQWSRDYLNEMQQRTKWREPQRNMKVGDLVLIREENAAPTLWKTGRIVEAFPGADGLVRNVRLKKVDTKGKEVNFSYLERPVQKLCLLLPRDIEEDSSRAQCVEADTTTVAVHTHSHLSRKRNHQMRQQWRNVKNRRQLRRRRRGEKLKEKERG